MSSYSKTSSKIDYGVILTVLLMAIFSCVSIYAAESGAFKQYSNNFVLKQIQWYVIGTIAAAFVMRFDSDQLKKLSWYLYGLGIVLLFGLAVAPITSITPYINGAQAWYVIPGAGSVQPSEFMKIFLIIVLSKLIVEHHEKFIRKTVKTDLWLMIKLGGITAVPLALIMTQPDLGTALVIISILLGLIVVGGITWKILVPLFSGAVVLISTIFYAVLAHPEWLEKYFGVQPYQLRRIYSWLDPYNNPSGDSYQLTRSFLAIGSGETGGKGLGNREVYLPEAHSDFIFAIVGETFGFIGASILISLFFMLIYHVTKAALQNNNEFYGYMCAGVISMLTFHVVQNVGMTIGVLPITGIPLPFISYGGSSLLANMMAIGLILSIRYHYKKYMFA